MISMRLDSPLSLCHSRVAVAARMPTWLAAIVAHGNRAAGL
jgi:hypothetical protein